MNTSTDSTFLKEMGIAEWSLRDAPELPSIEQSVHVQAPIDQSLVDRKSLGTWWFFGNKPQGDAQVLFQNMIRALGLSTAEWCWKNPAEKINPLEIPQDGTPLVAMAFGVSATQKLSGERDALAQLRETILSINAENTEEIPLIATFELNQILSKPKDKALLWQDLLLAKSVLQNL